MESSDMEKLRRCKRNIYSFEPAKKANRILEDIKGSYTDKSIPNIMYKFLCRLTLEYDLQPWNLRFIKDTGKTEAVQRKATKMIDEFDRYTYQREIESLKHSFTGK